MIIGCGAGTIAKVHNSQLAPMQMENITFFLEGCVALGMPRVSNTHTHTAHGTAAIRVAFSHGHFQQRERCV